MLPRADTPTRSAYVPAPDLKYAMVPVAAGNGTTLRAPSAVAARRTHRNGAPAAITAGDTSPRDAPAPDRDLGERVEAGARAPAEAPSIDVPAVRQLRATLLAAHPERAAAGLFAPLAPE